MTTLGTTTFRRVKLLLKEILARFPPEIPRGFFTTTDRVQFSPEEDFFHEEDVVKDDDHVTFVWEGTHKRDDEDDDDQDEPITVLNP